MRESHACYMHGIFKIFTYVCVFRFVVSAVALRSVAVLRARPWSGARDAGRR